MMLIEFSETFNSAFAFNEYLTVMITSRLFIGISKFPDYDLVIFFPKMLAKITVPSQRPVTKDLVPRILNSKVYSAPLIFSTSTLPVSIIYNLRLVAFLRTLPDPS